MPDNREPSKHPGDPAPDAPSTQLIPQFSENELGAVFEPAFRARPEAPAAPASSVALDSMAQAELSAIPATSPRHSQPSLVNEAKPAPAPAPAPQLPPEPTSQLFHIPQITPPPRTLSWSALPLGLRAGVILIAFALLALLGVSALLLVRTGRNDLAPLAEAAPAPSVQPPPRVSAPVPVPVPAVAIAPVLAPSVPAPAPVAAPAVPAPAPGATAAAPVAAPRPARARPAPPPRDEPEEEKDALEPSDILAVVVAHRASIVKCVQAEQERDPEVTGVLVMRLSLLPTGAVSSAEGRTKAFEGGPLEACMSEEIQRWTFPRHREAMPPFDFPFKL